MQGYVHSFQSLGTVDGPGVRFVTFLSGCNLRCGCCHNPDTFLIKSGNLFTPEQIILRAEKFKEYFGDKGGITVSGGEPLLQAEFVKEVFLIAKNNGFNTCLDTSGSILKDKVVELLSVTDRVLLDIKYTDNQSYLDYVGCSLDCVLEFLSTLNKLNIKTTIRQVIIPTKNDDEQNVLRLKKIVKDHACIDGVELLPFKKICKVKYDQLKIPFPFGELPTPTKEQMEKLNSLLTQE